MKHIAFIILSLFATSAVALEKNESQSLCFGNKYVVYLSENVSIGIGYSDKRLIPDVNASKFAQKWGVGLDFKVSNDSRFGFRLGYDDAGKSQADAIGIVWGKTF